MLIFEKRRKNVSEESIRGIAYIAAVLNLLNEPYMRRDLYYYFISNAIFGGFRAIEVKKMRLQ